METYNNLCTQFYELDKPTAPSEALNFYLEFARNANGPIFEPMCGTGRFLIPLLEAGFDIEGSDASSHMLSVCREKCAAKNLKPKLYQQFLQQMSFNTKYALIFIPSGSFGLITDPIEAKNCLRILHDHLLPNGKLVFEIETTDCVPPHREEPQVKEVCGSSGEKLLLTTTSYYHQINQIYHTLCRYELFGDQGKTQEETEDFQIRLYQHHEIDDWLSNAGLTAVARYSDYHFSKASGTDELIIYVCETINK